MPSTCPRTSTDALVALRSPPWPNSSATRSAAYDTFDAFDLWKLDVKALLGNKGPCLIAVWLTNKVKVGFSALRNQLAVEPLADLAAHRHSFAGWSWTNSFRRGVSLRLRPSGTGSRLPTGSSGSGAASRCGSWTACTGGATRVCRLLPQFRYL